MFKKNKTLWVIVALVAVVAIVVLILCLRGCGSQTEPDSKTVQTQDSVRTGKVSESENKTDNKTNTKSNSDKPADKSGDKATTDKDTAGKDSKEGNTAEEKNSSTSDSENHGSTSEGKNSSTSESENHTSTSDGNESSGESYSEPVYTPQPEPTPEPVTPAHVHSYTDTVIAPTCTTNGYTIHTCDCGDSYRDSNVSAWGHEWQPVYETRTVEKTEMQCHTFCAACGADLTAMGISGDAIGDHAKVHALAGEGSRTYQEWVEIPVVMEEEILTGYVCSRCGETKNP